MEQQHGLTGLGLAGCGEGVLVLLVDFDEHVLLVIGVFFCSDGWNRLLDESTEVFNTQSDCHEGIVATHL